MGQNAHKIFRKEDKCIFKERLKTLRQAKNLTQEAVAEKLGINRPSYTRYETGEREPNFETLKKIAVFFDVSADYLLGLGDK